MNNPISKLFNQLSEAYNLTPDKTYLMAAIEKAINEKASSFTTSMGTPIRYKLEVHPEGSIIIVGNNLPADLFLFDVKEWSEAYMIGTYHGHGLVNDSWVRYTKLAPYGHLLIESCPTNVPA